MRAVKKCTTNGYLCIAEKDKNNQVEEVLNECNRIIGSNTKYIVEPLTKRPN